MSGTLSMERRRHPRTQLEMSLQSIRLDPDAGQVVDSLRMVDISKSGVGVVSQRPFYPGQRILLSLPMNSLKGRLATVVRCRQKEQGYRVGLAFDGASAAAWCNQAATGFAAA